MKIRIPHKELLKDIDDVIELSHQFLVDCDDTGTALEIEADEDALFDFLIAYHNIDIQSAKETMSKYEVTNNQKSKRSFTPEEALQKINEFIVSKGGFDGYAEMYEALNNAINGMI